MPIGQKVVLIGGGHNALVTAFYLAKGGFKPLVLERREVVGGGAVTEEFHPGLKLPRYRTRWGRCAPTLRRKCSLRNSICRFSGPIRACLLLRPMAADCFFTKTRRKRPAPFRICRRKTRRSTSNSRRSWKKLAMCSDRLRRSHRQESTSHRQKICGTC